MNIISDKEYNKIVISPDIKRYFNIVNNDGDINVLLRKYHVSTKFNKDDVIIKNVKISIILSDREKVNQNYESNIEKTQTNKPGK